MTDLIEWRISDSPVPYPEAVRAMETRVAAIRAGHARELVWLLEHPPLYTAGTSARTDDLLQPDRFPVYASGRGGQYTYHGPGQRVVYVMLDLKRREPDLRRFVHDLEEWVIRALARFNIRGERLGGDDGELPRLRQPVIFERAVAKIISHPPLPLRDLRGGL